MSFQVQHDLSLFNLNCCLHMLLGVVIVQQPLRSIFATVIGEEGRRSAGMKHVSSVLNVRRTWFVMVLKCLCFYLPVVTCYPSDKPFPPVTTSALQLLMPSLNCGAHVSSMAISPPQTARHLRTFLSDEHRVNVKSHYAHTDSIFKDSWDALLRHHTCTYSTVEH